jgi:hypothetical protein
VAGQRYPRRSPNSTLEIPMKKTMFLAMALSLLAAPAFAKKNAKNYHCMMKDGTEATGKTKKSCKKAGGKWMKGTMAKSAPADATGTTTPPPEVAK